MSYPAEPRHVDTEVIRFTGSDTAHVVERMRDLVDRRNGWINFQPVLQDEDGESPVTMPPVRPGVLGLFSGRGPAVPVGTWVPGAKKRRGFEADSLGIQHGAGPKAARKLREAGVTAPNDWRVLSDHPKRGLVVRLPSETDPGAVLDWMIRACRELSLVQLPDNWVAMVHAR